MKIRDSYAHLRLFGFTLGQLEDIVTGRGHPDRHVWPDDARIEGIWIDHGMNPSMVMVKVSHPSFGIVYEGCRIPVTTTELMDRGQPDE